MSSLLYSCFWQRRLESDDIMPQVNAASIQGMIGCANTSVYAASKAIVISMTKSVAREVGPRNIRVNCISPGELA